MKLTLADLEAVSLKSGAHMTREEGMCAMEAAAYLAGEPHSDHPQCVSPVIAAFKISWNDGLPNDAERDRLLLPLIPLTIGTAGSTELDERRAWRALDWLVRVHTPAFMDLVPELHTQAEDLRRLTPYTDADAANTNQKQLAAARDAAWAAAWAPPCASPSHSPFFSPF